VLGKPASPPAIRWPRRWSAFADPDADTLELIRHLVAQLRPRGRGDEEVAERYRAMLDRLVADPALRTAFCSHVVHFIATRRLVTFFTDSGILPGTGFFSEWGRILGNRLLPEVPDERRLKDCLHVVFHRADDWRWLQEIPPDLSQRFWELVAPRTRNCATLTGAASRSRCSMPCCSLPTGSAASASRAS
jgi:site-specific recombinase